MKLNEKIRFDSLILELFHPNTYMLLDHEDFTILHTNHTGVDILQHSPHELIGVLFLEMISSKCQDRVMEFLNSVVKNNHGQLSNIHLRTKTDSNQLFNIKGLMTQNKDSAYIAIQIQATENKCVSGVTSQVGNKQLECLSKLSTVIQTQKTIPQILAECRDLLATGFQYPEITDIQIIFENLEYKCGSDIQSYESLSTPILINGSAQGSITVYYTEKRPNSDYGPFLPVETMFLELCAHQISEAINLIQMQKELQDSNNKFKSYFRDSVTGMAITSPDTGWIDVNNSLCRYLGFTESELKTKTWKELTHPDDLERDLEQFNQLLHGTRDDYELDKRFIRKDGSTVFAHIVVKAVRNPDGVINHFLAQVKDTTESAQADQAIRTANKELLAVFEGIEDVIYVSDPITYELLYLNDAFKSCWGNQAIGQKCHVILQDRDEPCPFCTNGEIFGEHLGKRYVWEFQNEINQRWYRCSDKAIRWFDGTFKRFEIAVDITDEKEVALQLEQQRRESFVLSQLAEIFLTTPTDQAYSKSLEVICNTFSCTAGVFGYIDDDGALICASKGLLAPSVSPKKNGLHRYSVKDLRAQSEWKKALVKQQIVHISVSDDVLDQKDYRSELIAPLSENSTTVGIIAIADQQTMFSDKDINLLSSLCQSLSSILVERRRFEKEMKRRLLVEERLRTANSDLVRSNTELEQFAYVASHDLQEPLRMVSSYTQLLHKKYEAQLDEKAQKYIKYAVDGAIRMQRLIQDLLQYSRVRSRGKTFDIIDVHDCLGRAIVNLRLSIEETNTIITNDDLPTVQADETQITQLFQNLLGNAIKFRSTISPHIHISCKQDNSVWQITVADNGIGISQEYFDRIFQIFQRLHTREQYPGTGIGLPLCKRIVQRHGGQIWVESTVNEGSKFHFTLPVMNFRRRIKDNE